MSFILNGILPSPLMCNLIPLYLLNDTKKPFKKISHGRYINFVAEYLANEKDATREDAQGMESIKEIRYTERL